MDNRTKHLEFIQCVVNRLSTNSFLLKGWSVLLVSALFALSASDAEPAFVFVAYVPALIFWGLDGYFLWQERLYRALYNRVRSPDAEADFSMDISVVRNAVAGWSAAVFSVTLLAFHGALLGAIVIVTVIAL